MKRSTNYENIKQQQQQLRQLALVVLALALFSDRLLLGCRSQPLEAGDLYDRNQPQQQQQHQTAEQLQSQDYLNYAKQRSPFMQVHKLPAGGNNQHITCNDGSQIGYYKRLNQHSKSWVIYLQGGGFCGTRESCRHRWQRSPHLMSSRFWPKTRTVDGILSSDPRENPYLWNANHIYVPYCSSDSWTGSAIAAASSEQQQQQQPRHDEPRAAGEFMASGGGGGGTPSSFAFMGSQILTRVFDSLYEDLPLRQSLYDAKFILLAGDSAGATGVIMNLDKMSSLVAGRAQQLRANCSEQPEQANACDPKRADPMLRGLADSGWFLDNEPYNFELDQFGGEPSSTSGVAAAAAAAASQRPGGGGGDDDECEQGRCTPSQSIKQAMRLWNGQAPEACAQRHPNEPWRCYFGYRAYQSLRTPLFVVQWLYDEAQLMVDNIVRPGTSGQWNYVHKVVNEMRASLENVTALFAPSCLSHSLIARKSWNQVNINGFKLPHILNSWEEQPLLEFNGSGGNSAISSTRQQQQQQQSESGNQQQQQQQQQQTGDRLGSDTLAGLVGLPASFETVLSEVGPSSNSNGNSNSNHHMAALYLRSAERLTLSQESRNQIGSKPSMAPTAAAANSANGQQAGPKSRSRKRKRNNQQQQQQQQQNRIKQSRQRANKQQQQQAPPPPLPQPQMQPLNEPLDQSSIAAATSSQSRDANDLNHQPPSPMQDLLPLAIIDRSLLGSSSSSLSSDLLYGRADQTGASSSATTRLGRSTFVEDGSLVLGNNVPDDGASSRLAQMTAGGSGSTIGLLGEQSSETRSPAAAAATTTTSTIASRSSFSPDQFRFIDTCGWPQCNRDCPVLDFEFSSAVSFQF